VTRIRPPGPHPALLAATWALGGAVAVAAGFGAVRLVGDEVAQRSTAPLSEGSVAEALSGLTPAPSTTPPRPVTSTPTAATPIAPTSSPTATPAPGRSAAAGDPNDGSAGGPVARPRSFVLVGGRVLVSCTGSTLSLRYAVPADGFRSEVDRSDREKLEASFESAGHHSQLSVRCQDGTPVGTLEEQVEDGERVTPAPGPDR
jgi:hypothetical protein